MKNKDNNHKKVIMQQLPDCDFCVTTKAQAKYDGKTKFGPWGYMCQEHFYSIGIGLGLGKGQELVLAEERINE